MNVVSMLTMALVLVIGQSPSAGTGAEYLSDVFDALVVKHHQEWGKLGLNTAAVPPDGRQASRLRIGEKEYAIGIGHHAKGEIVLNLGGKYETFEAKAGVQWQGGHRGSTVLQVLVDGEKRFDSGVMSDSDAPKEVRVSVHGARELRLVAGDAGDGYGCDMATWAEARLVRDPYVPDCGRPVLTLGGNPAPPVSSSVCGFTVVAGETGPQVALTASPRAFIVCVREGEEVNISVPVSSSAGSFTVAATVAALCGDDVDVSLALGEKVTVRKISHGKAEKFEVTGQGPIQGLAIRLKTSGRSGEAAVQWSGVSLHVGDRSFEIPVSPERAKSGNGAPPTLPTLRGPIEQALIEWDWRMQDGIGTERAASTWSDAVKRTLDRGTNLIRDLQRAGASLGEQVSQWEGLQGEWKRLSTAEGVEPGQWENLWRRVHRLRRSIALTNPLAKPGPLVFVKQVPGRFSHQLTQYYGRLARPGGGVFVLDAPGRSMQCRQLAAGALPTGSYQHPEVSYEGDMILFSFCHTEATPQNRAEGNPGRYFHLHEMAADGSGLRALTDGAFDDFSPRYLPNGQIVFISTRRLGWHRCGYPGCENYTLALANADGSEARPISYHETQEWDPVVLDDGRILYTRWDYVDRHAVYYEQLWAVRPDGSAPTAYYGNNTFNPVGIWEARPVPGTGLVIATAGAHHAMTAGSIILVDVNKGVDGPGSIARLTPDALFPESETHVAPKGWYAPAGITTPPPVPVDQQRWPGHCYRTPYPLSDKYFLTAYSFDELIGEPDANPANMFGLYLVDCFGNKELLYRDLNIASLWPTPIRPRPRPAVLAPVAKRSSEKEGTFFVQNVYEAQPGLTGGSIQRLRIVQVVPKSTPGANRPPVGIPNASPGKRVLGTVPVEADGSAYFRAPVQVPLSFQALDESGQAVQVMRSVTYLQPGENASCVGCHESRTSVPSSRSFAKALSRQPSEIELGPDGSSPLSYPILVQPVLDKRCVACHCKEKPDGGVILTGQPEGHYTVSYNALAPRVSFSTWGGKEGDFRVVNSEPLSKPGFFGAKGSSLMKLLHDGHEKVTLDREELERLITWMDANALFYGTFDPEDQARQQRGERIAGPKLQ